MYQFVIAIVVIIVVQRLFQLIFGGGEEEEDTNNSNRTDSTNNDTNENDSKADSKKEASASRKRSPSADDSSSSAAAAAAVHAPQPPSFEEQLPKTPAEPRPMRLFSDGAFANDEAEVAAFKALAEALQQVKLDGYLFPQQKGATAGAAASSNSSNKQQNKQQQQSQQQHQSLGIQDEVKKILSDFCSKDVIASNDVPTALLRAFAKEAEKTVDALVALAMHHATTTASSQNLDVADNNNSASAAQFSFSSNKQQQQKLSDALTWLLTEVLPPCSRHIAFLHILTAGESISPSTNTFFALRRRNRRNLPSYAIGLANNSSKKNRNNTAIALLQTNSAVHVDFFFVTAEEKKANPNDHWFYLPPGVNFDIAHRWSRSAMVPLALENQSIVLCRDRQMLSRKTRAEAGDVDETLHLLDELFRDFEANYVVPTVTDVSLDEVVASSSESEDKKDGEDNSSKNNSKQQQQKLLTDLLTPRSSGDLLIRADGGCGKTSAALFIFAHFLKQWREDNHNAFPVLLSMHNFTQKDITTRGALDTAVAAAAGCDCVEQFQRFFGPNEERQLIVILDGLDESRTSDDKHLHKLIDRNPVIQARASRIFATTRNSAVAKAAKDIFGSKRYNDNSCAAVEFATVPTPQFLQEVFSAVRQQIMLVEGQQQQQQVEQPAGKSKNKASAAATAATTATTKITLSDAFLSQATTLACALAARLATQNNGTKFPGAIDNVPKLPHPNDAIDAFIVKTTTGFPRPALGKLSHDLVKKNGHCTLADAKKITGLNDIATALASFVLVDEQQQAATATATLAEKHTDFSFLHTCLAEHIIIETCIAMGTPQVLEDIPPHLSVHITKKALKHRRCSPQLRELLVRRLIAVERDMQAAIVIMKEQVELAERVMASGQLKDDGPLLGALFNLSNIYLDSNEIRNARDTLQRTFILAIKKFGPMSPQVGDVLFRLGICLRSLGELEQARDKFQHALKVRTQVQGDASPAAMEVMWNLSRVHGALGERDRQKDVAETAMKACEKNFSDCAENINYAQSLDCLAEAVGASGDGQKMWELLQQSLRIKEKVLGSQHPMVQEARATLRHVLEQLQMNGVVPQTAAPGGTGNSNIGTSSLGSNHTATGTSPSTSPPTTLTPVQADAMRRRSLFETELSQRVQRFGDKDLQVADSLFNLGVACAELEQHRDARDKLAKALPIFEKNLGPKHEQVGWTRLYLGNALTALRDPNGAKEMLQGAAAVLGDYAQSDECSADQAASVYNDLGVAFLKLGDAPRATELLEKALEIDRAEHGAECTAESATTIVHLADACGRQGDLKRKCELLEEVVQLKEVHRGPHHAEVADALFLLSKALSAAGEEDRAEDAMRRAKKIFAKHNNSL